MIRHFRNLLQCFRDEKPLKEPMSPKDPMDWRLTPNSKPWDTERYCPQCKSPTTHRERMSYICNSCGYMSIILLTGQGRVFREIWDGEKWVWQYKYGNGTNDYEIREKKYI